MLYVGASSVLTNNRSDNVHLVYSTVDKSDLSSVPDLEAAINVEFLDNSGTVTFFTENMSNTDSLSLDDTIPLSPQSSSPVLPSSHLEEATLGYIKSLLVDSFLRYVTESDQLVFESCCPDLECGQWRAAGSHWSPLLSKSTNNWWSTIWGVCPPKVDSGTLKLEGIPDANEQLHPTSRKIIHSVVYPAVTND